MYLWWTILSVISDSCQDLTAIKHFQTRLGVRGDLDTGGLELEQSDDNNGNKTKNNK